MEKIGNLERLNEYRWLLPQTGKMRVPGIIYASEKMIPKILSDNSPEQVANMATLPGIVKYSLAMPDIHWGYGAPIGGVAAFDAEKGVIVPGIVGYDINCGLRLIKTNLRKEDIKEKLPDLVNKLFYNIPSGVGSTGKIKLNRKELENVLKKGAAWAVENGYGDSSDLKVIEENGTYHLADPDKVSNRAYERGTKQLGTLGAGNHFLEIQVVEKTYSEDISRVFGLFPGQIIIMVHTGSRGLGYQVCDDYLHLFGKTTQKYGIEIPDRQLVCAPINSEEGKSYLGAMASAANYAWANREIISFWVGETIKEVLGTSLENIGFSLLYDVAHNIGKIETHNSEGKKIKLYVHRKGATRAFAAGLPEVPEIYRNVGQPVIIPGTMGTASYVLVGTKKAMEETWGSICHGAGRVMSRHEAVRRSKGRRIDKELAEKGILAKAKSFGGLSEEMPEAYKDVDEVVEVVDKAGLSNKVARLLPLAVIKG